VPARERVSQAHTDGEADERRGSSSRHVGVHVAPLLLPRTPRQHQKLPQRPRRTHHHCPALRFAIDRGGGSSPLCVGQSSQHTLRAPRVSE
jgi:hypothetical protein